MPVYLPFASICSHAQVLLRIPQVALTQAPDSWSWNLCTKTSLPNCCIVSCGLWLDIKRSTSGRPLQEKAFEWDYTCTLVGRKNLRPFHVHVVYTIHLSFPPCLGSYRNDLWICCLNQTHVASCNNNLRNLHMANLSPVLTGHVCPVRPR